MVLIYQCLLIVVTPAVILNMRISVLGNLNLWSCTLMLLAIMIRQVVLAIR